MWLGLRLRGWRSKHDKMMRTRGRRQTTACASRGEADGKGKAALADKAGPSAREGRREWAFGPDRRKEKGRRDRGRMDGLGPSGGREG